MSKHIVKGYITRTQYKWQAKPSFGFSMYKPTENYTDTVVVAERQIEVEVPDDFDPRPAMVARLEEQKKQVTAEFAKTIKEINERIQSLLALEMSA